LSDSVGVALDVGAFSKKFVMHRHMIAILEGMETVAAVTPMVGGT
jgi:hypothetical protein